MRQRFVERHLAAATVLGTIAAIVFLSAIGSVLADRISEWLAHGLGHAVVALPVGALAVLARRAWPAPRALAPGRLARSIVVFGLGGLATGQLLEVLGARVDEPNAHAIEEIGHTAGQIVTILSMLLLLAGVVMTAIAGARAGAVPRWLVALGSLIALGFVLFMLLGGPIR